MRQKTHYGQMPPPYEIEQIGRNTAHITFNVNAEEVIPDWQADTYTLITAWTADIAERVENNYDQWIAHAKAVDYDKAADDVRACRNKLLKETDAEFVIDRLKLNTTDLAESITKALTGDWASYRQALRDVPEQEGFPYDVTWPDRP